MRERLFADVILPLSLPNLLTYEVPGHLIDLIPGKRVIVQLGKQKFYSAIVRRIHSEVPPFHDIKEIQSILDDEPVINEMQFKLWEWLSSYYVCNLGEVMNAALPAAMKLQSETRIILNPDYPHDHNQLEEKQFLVYKALLSRDELTLTEVSQLIQRKSVHHLLKNMLEQGVILVAEEVHQKYKPKREARISLGEEYSGDESLKEVFESLESRSPKQLESLMVFLKLLYEQPVRNFVLKRELLSRENVSTAAVSALLKKEILNEEVVEVDRLVTASGPLSEPMELNAAQKKCYEEIRTSFETNEVVLLHGITSSGKTEVYIHLIGEELKKGKQVLYLLPEIALTTQMINRLRKYFGSRVGVYHSRQSSNERVEVWNAVHKFDSAATGVNQTAQVILGARSALFLPYSNLGLVIVDEEHDSSYKQNDPAPRYQGRDTAMVLAKMSGAKTILGSATPSLESYFNAKEKKYGLVNLMERYGGMELPEILVCDTREATKKRQMKSHFTPQLIDAVEAALQNKEQVILFQNRRGFAPVLECKNCSWIPQCKNCSVTLTYHKQISQLKCHYCGYSQNPPSVCLRCGDHQLEVKGYGTEKIEEEIAIFFPDASVARLDLDATKSRNAFQKIISDFEERKINILVGTQMVTKGLDFENVSTVGIVNADQLLNFPDFRAHERSYQLMSQVSGRSGRKFKRGRVLIQSQQPGHWVIKDVVDHNYNAFFETDLSERRKFSYPPHTRIIEIILKHKDADFLNAASFHYADALRKHLGNRIIGPHQPLVSRIKNLWLKHVLVKIEKDVSASKVKQIIRDELRKFQSVKENQSVYVLIDVDPN